MPVVISHGWAGTVVLELAGSLADLGVGGYGAATSFSGKDSELLGAVSALLPRAREARPAVPSCEDGAGTRWLPLRVKDAFSCQKVPL